MTDANTKSKFLLMMLSFLELKENRFRAVKAGEIRKMLIKKIHC